MESTNNRRTDINEWVAGFPSWAEDLKAGWLLLLSLTQMSHWEEETSSKEDKVNKQPKEHVEKAFLKYQDKIFNL